MSGGTLFGYDISSFLGEQEEMRQIPSECKLSDAECHTYLSGRLYALADRPNKDTLLCQENINWLYQNHTPSSYYQTETWHAVGSLNKGRLSNYLVESGYSQTTVEADPPYDRDAYILSGVGGAGGGGEGGIQALDPELIAGTMWEGPSTEKEEFNILYAMQAGFLPAVRPGKGGAIINHPDRHTTIRIMSVSGEVIFATTNIMVEKIDTMRRETFSPSYAVDGFAGYFGEEAPQQARVSGKLIDAANFDWLRKWEEVYDKLGRGSILSKNKWRMYILYKAKIYEGYPLDNQIFEAAMAEPQVPFSFSFMITNRKPLPQLMVYTDPNGEIYEKYGGETTEDMLNDIQELGLTQPMSEYSPGELPEGTTEYTNPDYET